MSGRGMAPSRRERLMRALYTAEDDLLDLAAREKLTLTRLAEWANHAETAAALEGLCRLNDARAQLLVSRYRTLAAAKLFELAKDEGSQETARKACVDLLKVSLVPISAAMEGGPDEPTITLDAKTALAILGHAGREAMEPPGAELPARKHADVERDSESHDPGDDRAEGAD